MKKIQNIIVATDLSATARNAYSYENELAKSLNASLTIIHVQEHLLMVSDVMITTLPSEDNAELINDIKQMVSEENANSNASPNQEVKIKILKGNPVDVLTKLSEESDVDLIVIGTTGLADGLTKVFGSTSIKISNKAHCPVILVPRDVQWQPIHQIMFASNYDSVTPETIKHINDFALEVHSGIHFVSVMDAKAEEGEEQKETDWSAVKTDPAVPMQTHTIYGKDPIEKLDYYSSKNKIDLMAFVSKHRTFWENLVHKSVTEHLSISATIPLLVMHTDDKQ